MVIKLNSGEECNLSFSNNCVKLTNWSSRNLFAEWYKNGEFYGSMPVNGHTWAAMPFDSIDEWKIDIVGEYSFTNSLQGKNVLINATLESNDAIEKLNQFCKDAYIKHKCHIYVYTKMSHLLNLKSEYFQTLRLNNQIEIMSLGLNKTF
jgi:hypothetical protein